MLGEDGHPAAVWRQFFMALWNRTGGGVGVQAGPDTTQALAVEAANRIAGDAALGTALAGETAARTDADTLLTTAVSNETAARIAADQVLVSNGTANLNGSIATEQAARIIADTVLAADIAAIRVLALWVNGDVPVGIMCNPDGTPIYVPVAPP
jgi:hypothetical protein